MRLLGYKSRRVFHRYSGGSDTASLLLSDYTQADLALRDRRMLDFAVRMVVKPAALAQSDVASLPEVVFKDSDIVSIVLVTCLFSFVNRVASSLSGEVSSERDTIIREKRGIICLTTGNEHPYMVVKTLLMGWETLILLDQTVPRPFARFRFPNGRISLQSR